MFIVVQNSNKGDRERKCSLCKRNFVNRSAYNSHTRTCRKNASNDEGTDSTATNSTSPLLPIVSLTPIVASGLVSKDKNDSGSPPKNQTKKVALPLSTSSSSSKKIGIQVRMNYCKEGINQSSSIGAGCSAQLGQSQTNTENSGRNSGTSVTHDEKSIISKVDLNGHNTRSSSKLALILKTLLNKRGVKVEDSEHTGIMEAVNRNEVTIYCEDCKTAYALNDKRWSTENDTPRSYKCALRDCDFRSAIRDELLPHLSARHPVLSENELAEVNSIFIAESSGVKKGEGKYCCHKRTSRERSLERRKRELTEKSRFVTPPNPAPKRKLNADSNEKAAKRQVVIKLKKKPVSSADDGKAEINTAIIEKNDVSKHQSTAGDGKLEDSQVGKKKCVPKNDDCRPPRIRKKKPLLVDPVLPNVFFNGLETSGDKMKVASKLPKISTLVEPTPFSSTPGIIQFFFLQ